MNFFNTNNQKFNKGDKVIIKYMELVGEIIEIYNNTYSVLYTTADEREIIEDFNSNDLRKV